jgi:serine/threonine-protein kinase
MGKQRSGSGKKVLKHIKERCHAILNGLKAYARTKTRKEWTILTASFLVGALSVILFIDMVIMPLYLRHGHDISVPDLIGKTWEEGYWLARESRLSLITDGAEYHATVGKDRIASQRPGPGTKVKPHRGIHVVMSRGQKYVTIPDVVGKPLADAEKLIHEAGLIITQKQVRSSSRVPSGSVLRQNPKAGEDVETGTEIELHIVK